MEVMEAMEAMEVMEEMEEKEEMSQGYWIFHSSLFILSSSFFPLPFFLFP